MDTKEEEKYVVTGRLVSGGIEIDIEEMPVPPPRKVGWTFYDESNLRKSMPVGTRIIRPGSLGFMQVADMQLPAEAARKDDWVESKYVREFCVAMHHSGSFLAGREELLGLYDHQKKFLLPEMEAFRTKSVPKDEGTPDVGTPFIAFLRDGFMAERGATFSLFAHDHRQGGWGWDYRSPTALFHKSTRIAYWLPGSGR